MFNELMKDLYGLLKQTWWGRAVIAVVIIASVGYFVLMSPLPSLLFGADGAASSASSGAATGAVVRDDAAHWRNFPSASCSEAASKKPRQDYELAQRISDVVKRERELSSIAGDALCLNDEPLANEILSRIESAQSKDQAIRRAVEHYVRSGDLSNAQHWIDRLSIQADRDWWQQRALERARKGA